MPVAEGREGWVVSVAEDGEGWVVPVVDDGEGWVVPGVDCPSETEDFKFEISDFKSISDFGWISDSRSILDF